MTANIILNSLGGLGPEEIERTYRVREGLYLLGILERGVTVFKQQVRAHNLVFALWELQNKNIRSLGRVAVVGGGISGLTVAAAISAKFGPKTPVTIFERLWDLCSLQQGSDVRWLHPHIYDWPDKGSRAPGASLPILNWSEGRASDISRMILRNFGEHCEQFGSSPDAPRIILGLKHFQVRTLDLEISWIGTNASRSDAFFKLFSSEGTDCKFDTIIIAAGFGLERTNPQYRTESYWRNEPFGQPNLSGGVQRYVISGYGDGALVDLCRLTIERFRQDTIVYELFSNKLTSVEEALRETFNGAEQKKGLFDCFQKIEGSLLFDAMSRLAGRVRKDTSVVLHIGGSSGKLSSFKEIFGPTSSRLNRLLTYLLYRCGVFSIEFGSLSDCIARQPVAPNQVLCRHGVDAGAHLRSMLVDYEVVEARLDEIQQQQAQTPLKLWYPGTFPVVQAGGQR